MYFGIGYAIHRVEADDDLAGLVITGTGDVFAPGGDLGGGGGEAWMDFGSLPMAALTPYDALRTSTKPIVAAVNGLAQAGGVQIALCSDMAVVSDRATFRVPELFRGIADTYFSQMLARIIGPVRTRDLMMTGRTLTAQEALQWGLVSRVVLTIGCSTPRRKFCRNAQEPRLRHVRWSRPAWTTISGSTIG